jgi:hypothetical protein
MEMDSLDKVVEQLVECEGLYEQGESGFEWQQMESNVRSSIFLV